MSDFIFKDFGSGAKPQAFGKMPRWNGSRGHQWTCAAATATTGDKQSEPKHAEFDMTCVFFACVLFRFQTVSLSYFQAHMHEGTHRLWKRCSATWRFYRCLAYSFVSKPSLKSENHFEIVLKHFQNFKSFLGPQMTFCCRGALDCRNLSTCKYNTNFLI